MSVSGGMGMRGGATKALATFACALAVLAFLAAPAARAQTAYLADKQREALVPVDLTTGTLGAPIDTGHYPAHLAITPDGSRALLTNFVDHTVIPVDLGAGVAGSPASIDGEQIAISPNGEEALVSSLGLEAVIPIDVATDTAGEPIPVGHEPRGIAFSPDGRTAYVTITTPAVGDLVPIDLATGTAGTPIAVGSHPVGVAISPNGRTAYVVDEEVLGRLFEVDLETASIFSAPVQVELKYPHYIAITPDDRKAYVISYSGAAASEIDLGTGEGGQKIPLGAYPEDIAMSADGRTAWIDTEEGALIPISTATDKPGEAIDVGGEPGAMAIAPAQTPRPAFSVAAASAGSPTVFDASASTDSGGGMASYSWSFGDGGTATGPKPSHVFSAPGSYAVKLTLDSGSGCRGFLATGSTALCNGPATASTTKQVVVPAPAPAPSPQTGKHPRPRVRVSCPPAAALGGCRISVRALVAKPRKGKQPRFASAVAKVKLKAGKSAILTLKPKPAYAAKLAAAKKILVLEKVSFAGETRRSFPRLKRLG